MCFVGYHLTQTTRLGTVYQYDGEYRTPLGRFSLVDISTVGMVPVPKRSAFGNVSPRAFRRRDFRNWYALSWLSSDRAWKHAPGVCVEYTVEFSTRAPQSVRRRARLNTRLNCFCLVVVSSHYDKCCHTWIVVFVFAKARGEEICFFCV